MVAEDGDGSKEVVVRIIKARLGHIWRSRKKTKCKIFKVLSVLLYRSDCWKMAQTMTCTPDTFQTQRTSKIKRVFWPNTSCHEKQA